MNEIVTIILSSLAGTLLIRFIDWHFASQSVRHAMHLFIITLCIIVIMAIHMVAL